MIEIVEFNILRTIERVERVEFNSVRYLRRSLNSTFSTVAICQSFESNATFEHFDPVCTPSLQSGLATPMLVSQRKSTYRPCVKKLFFVFFLNN